MRVSSYLVYQSVTGSNRGMRGRRPLPAAAAVGWMDAEVSPSGRGKRWLWPLVLNEKGSLTGPQQQKEK